jgi:outer membrane protein
VKSNRRKYRRQILKFERQKKVNMQCNSKSHSWRALFLNIKNNLCLILVLAGSSFSSQAYSQIFTLNDLINRALDENYQIRIVRNHEAIAANNNTLGMAGFLPSVGVVGQTMTSTSNTFTRLYTGDTRVGDNAQSNVVNAFVEFNWVVFDGMMMFARKDQLNHLQRLGELQTRFYMEQTVSDLAKAYYQLILERQLLENYRQSLKISTFRRDLEQRKLVIGTGTGLLYRQAVVDFNNDSAVVVSQKAAIKSLEIQLNRIINRPLEDEIIPASDEIPLTIMESKNVLVTRAARANRDIMSSYVEELFADAAYREELGRRYPEISVFGNYTYSRQTNEVGLTVLNRNYGPQVGIRVRFNLYNGNQQNIRTRNAEIQRDIAGLESENIALMVEANLIDFINQHDALQERLNLISLSISSATEALEIAQRQLAAGAISGYDFRFTQMALLQVRNSMAVLTYEQKNREIDILRISGALLDMRM